MNVRVEYHAAIMCTFQVNPEKAKKKSIPKKKSLYFLKWSFLALILKNFLNFDKRKLFFQKQPQAYKMIEIHPGKLIILQETKTPNNFFMFQETETLRTPYISGNNFQNSKSKKFLIFREMKLFFLKQFLFIFQKEN